MSYGRQFDLSKIVTYLYDNPHLAPFLVAIKFIASFIFVFIALRGYIMS